ncbi:hypothetical protein [Bartonella tamiae]|uniref:Uncharacterized protein n=1 Tax=Bartonella tamiae Th239 TaxID=1094558 RepID=J0QX01_9HYPH|nr:hypothetical protein [Bartonella tamiae]EJF90566.1 hypothetical protein ME5_00967 [Bartonella tamiae Th239]EJF94056.1 hypothetical protein MEG_00914 [Bartonella tamiae Th307]
MRSIKIFITLIGFMLTTIPLSYSAGINPAQVANMTSEFAGERCSTPPKGSGVVAGFFRGWKQTPFQDKGSGLMPVDRYRCFTTIEKCQSWLKTMTFYYNDKTIDASMCTKF